MYGYANRMLNINLSERRISIEPISNDLLVKYLGGKGLGAKLFSDEAALLADPFDSSNSLVLATGPVNGLTLSGAARLCAVFKSPLTGIWGESQCGGYFASQLKFAGYDAIVVKGKSEVPVYLLVEDEKVEIRTAEHLWGKSTFETDDMIKRDDNRSLQVLSIGPAGENLVRYACISHDKGRELGRCGGGAVMGSKKLKAIAVHGTGRTSCADPEGLEAFNKELNKRIAERLKSLRDYGTPNMLTIVDLTGSLPTRNWTQGHFEEVERISPETIKMSIMKQSKACFSCAVACRKVSRIESGPYAGTEVEGPEYETLYAFGPLCGNSDLESVVKANEVCDRLGIDTISAGNAVAFSMECYEKGLLTDKDTHGLDLEFGNGDAIIELLERIACRDGLGNVLAEGVQRASRIISGGSAKFAVHIKGLEPPGYDPRGLKGVALAYAVSCRGACHLRHMSHRPNLTGSHPFGGKSINRLSYEGQAQLVADLEDFYAIVDSLVLCKFVCLPAVGPIQWDEIIELYTIVTGMKVDKKYLVAKGRAVNNIIRQMNSVMGIDKEADSLPSRFTDDPLLNGASAGERVEKREFKRMLRDYYRCKGWTKEGRPKDLRQN